MRQCFLVILAIFAFGAATVKADMAPLPPTPPPPSGPDKAVIRGVGVQQVYTYWRGRRWMTVIDSCASSQPACRGKDLPGCFVVGLDDRPVTGGDIAILVASESAAATEHMKLMLEHCGTTELELGR